MKFTKFERAVPDYSGHPDIVAAQKLCIDAEIFMNNLYQVHRRVIKSTKGFAEVVHLSIRRLDRYPIHDWRHLQRIKNELAGKDYLGIEVYPPEDQLVDTSNQYHLWCTKDLFLPWIFRDRMVSEATVGKSSNRKFEEDERPPDLLTAEDLLKLAREKVEKL